MYVILNTHLFEKEKYLIYILQRSLNDRRFWKKLTTFCRIAKKKEITLSLYAATHITICTQTCSGAHIILCMCVSVCTYLKSTLFPISLRIISHVPSLSCVRTARSYYLFWILYRGSIWFDDTHTCVCVCIALCSICFCCMNDIMATWVTIKITLGLGIQSLLCGAVLFIGLNFRTFGRFALQRNRNKVGNADKIY